LCTNITSMIQRIQSLYLLLTLALGVIFFFSCEYLTLTISILTILISILSLFTIFLFSKRKIQMKLTKILVALIIVFICVTGYYTFNIMSEYNASFTFGSWIKAAIPVFQLLMAVLAYLSMKRDDNLVKSYDRLR
jgi:CDP-diglyceride synthetase